MNFTSKIVTKISGSDNLDTAFDIILKEICTHTKWPYGEIWKPDNHNEQLKYVTSYDWGKHIFENYKKFTSICKFGKGVGLIGRVWEKRSPVWLDELSDDKNFLRLEPAKKAGLNSAFSFPLELNEDYTLVAAFFLHKKNSSDIVKSEDIINASGKIAKVLVENFSFK